MISSFNMEAFATSLTVYIIVFLALISIVILTIVGMIRRHLANAKQRHTALLVDSGNAIQVVIPIREQRQKRQQQQKQEESIDRYVMSVHTRKSCASDETNPDFYESMLRTNDVHFFPMSDGRTRIDEYLPSQGLLYFDEELKYVVSKPKIMPLKSLTLEKLETLQNDAQEKLKQQEKLGQDFQSTE